MDGSEGLTGDELRALWHRLDVDLRALVVDASAPEDCAAEVRDYLDHNEFGLAWERLNRCLVNPKAEIRATMNDLAGLMWPERRNATYP